MINLFAVLDGSPYPGSRSRSCPTETRACSRCSRWGCFEHCTGPVRRSASSTVADEPHPRVVIAARRTAGHVVPALAVADALRAGAPRSASRAPAITESTLVPAAGYEIDFLRIRGLDRSNPVKAAGALGLARALPAAARILREREADAVMGGGGHAVPVGAAAVADTGLPLVLTEADRHFGLAKPPARTARAAGLPGFPIDGLEGRQYQVTGRPMPAGIVMADRSAARARFGARLTSAVCWSSAAVGRESVNDAALDVLLDPGRRNFHVIHITGTRDFAGAKGRVGSPHPAGYTLIEYEPTLADALAPRPRARSRRRVRSWSWPPQADPRSSCPTHTRRAGIKHAEH